MIIDVPFTYDADSLRKRKQKAEKVRVADTIPVEISEVATEDAPIVCMFRGFDHREHEAGPRAIRRVDGEFFREAVVHGFVGNARRPYTVDEMLGFLERGETPYGAGRFWPRQPYPGTTNIDSIPDLKRVLSTNRDEVVDGLHLASRRFLICDGMVLVACAEPVLKVSETYFTSRYRSIDVVELPSEFEQRCDLHRLDRIGALLAEAEADGHETTRERWEKKGAELLRPDLLDFDDAATNLAICGKYLLDGQDDRLKDVDVAFFATYAAARDAVRAYRAGHMDTGDMAMALRDLLSAIESNHLDRYASFFDETRKALERWSEDAEILHDLPAL